MQPLLLIDANWLAYKLFRSKGVKMSSNKCLTDRLVELASLFVGAGFQVKIVQDGDYHHHSKRATIKRASDREKSRILSVQARCTLMSLPDELNNCGVASIR